jgi:hypothetical protein
MRVSGFRSRLIFRRRGGGRELLDVVGMPTRRSAEAPAEQSNDLGLPRVDDYTHE